MDKDKNGTLDVKEFTNLVAAVLKKPPENAPTDGNVKQVETTKELIDSIVQAFFSYVKGEGSTAPISKQEFDENIEALGFLVSSYTHGGWVQPSVCEQFFTAPFSLKKIQLLLLGRPPAKDMPLAMYIPNIAAGVLVHRGQLKKGDIFIPMAISGAMASELKKMCVGDHWYNASDGEVEDMIRLQLPGIYNENLLPKLEAKAREDFGRHFAY